MEILREEIEARERTKSITHRKPSKESSQPSPTGSTLFTGSQKVSCSYCQQEHPSNSCGVVVQPQARKQVLQRAGRCFICLRRGHVSKDCTCNRKCSKCSGRHHISICTKGSAPQRGQSSNQTPTNPPQPPKPPPPSTNSAASMAPTASREQATPPTQGNQGSSRSGLSAEASTFQSQQSRSTAMWASAGQTILLQTAKALASNPSHPE